MGSISKYKYLVTNIGLLTLSNFATRILSFFLVPLYTNVLSTVEYGTYDLFNTTIGLILPLITLNIQDSIIRFLLDKNKDKTAIVTVGFQIILFSNIIFLLLILINYYLSFSLVVKEYSVFFFLMYFCQSFSSLMLAYTRGSEKIKELSVSSVISSFTIILSNIILLISFDLGLEGYFLANSIGLFIQNIYLLVSTKMLNDVSLKTFYKAETVSMVRYSMPMIANTIGWWINNASDKYVVTLFCGIAENGIYSIGSKVPSILNVFQSIFSQAWTLSAVKDFDPLDVNGFFSNTYSIYNCFLVIICSLIILLDKPLSSFLYSKEFYKAWIYVPWLTIAILFGSLSGYLGGFFSATMDSKNIAKSTMTGAVLNFLLNLCLTPFIGALGAAIATTVSYVITWAIRFKQSKKYINLSIKLNKHLFSYLLLFCQSIFLLIFEGPVAYIIQFLIFISMLYIYHDAICLVASKLINHLNNK